ncbi:pectinacetylesterase family protein [Striga asiatica]|uniref:Pectin acetylesterase n=1 Tax=Striga asiatica TaxID=4170 RepID=A0A5A7PD99_STRAF|nr:pectinacetylesterase family protein [Striga asiatica]
MNRVSLTLFTCFLIILLKVKTDTEVDVTILESATAIGAVCLDGSPPSYAMDQGSGSGSSSWVIFIEGGGWCSVIADCVTRAGTFQGSSLYRNKFRFTGILDVNSEVNPDFYNWNRVALLYCDGSSFFGDVEYVDPQNKLYFRGSRIFKAIIQELVAKGMNFADNIIFSGGSAGGLATILNCDTLRFLAPDAKKIKCVSDSGFFLQAPNLPGATQRETYFGHIVQLHCLFPENIVEDIQTPLFLIESSFDAFQVESQYTPYVGGGRTEWYDCVNVSLSLCNSTQLEKLQEFHTTFIQTLQNLVYSHSRGMFVHNCYRHGQILANDGWKFSDTLENKTIADAMRDWYFDDADAFVYIDTTNSPRNCTL